MREIASAWFLGISKKCWRGRGYKVQHSARGWHLLSFLKSSCVLRGSTNDTVRHHEQQRAVRMITIDYLFWFWRGLLLTPATQRAVCSWIPCRDYLFFRVDLTRTTAQEQLTERTLWHVQNLRTCKNILQEHHDRPHTYPIARLVLSKRTRIQKHFK